MTGTGSHIDYLAPDFVANAHAWVRAARAGGGPVTCPFGEVVLGYDEQRRLLARTDVHVPGLALLERSGVTDGPLHEFFGRQLLARNGDDHRRLRRLVSPAFAPRALEPFRPEIAALFAAQVEPHLAEAGTLDAVAATARFPVTTICRLFGAPLELADELAHWVPTILSMFDPDLDRRRAKIEQAVVSLEAALSDLVETRRTTPGDDLVSALITLESDGDRLSHDELVMLCAAVLIGGTESTRLQLLNTIALFGEHPEQWQRLRRDPSLIEGAIDEALRFRPVPHAAYRTVTSPDAGYQAGTDIVCDFLAANRDPAVHDRPDEFDVGRPDNAHLTFGFGAHFCLGGNLARIELIEAIGQLVSRIAAFEITEVEHPKGYSNSWGPSRLVLRWR